MATLSAAPAPPAPPSDLLSGQVGRQLVLKAVVVFVSLMFFGWLWGLPGAFVAVPVVVVSRIVGERVPSIQAIAEFLGR